MTARDLHEMLRASVDLPADVVAERSDALARIRDKHHRYSSRAQFDRSIDAASAAAFRLAADILDNLAGEIERGEHRAGATGAPQEARSEPLRATGTQQ